MIENTTISTLRTASPLPKFKGSSLSGNRPFRNGVLDVNSCVFFPETILPLTPNPPALPGRSAVWQFSLFSSLTLPFRDSLGAVFRVIFANASAEERGFLMDWLAIFDFRIGEAIFGLRMLELRSAGRIWRGFRRGEVS